MSTRNTTSNTSLQAIFGAAVLAAACYYFTGCGLSTPGGFVAGTTGYLAEFNRGKGTPMDLHADEERSRVAGLIARGGR